jgi:hypothetical protein
VSELFGKYYVKPTAGACVRAWSVCGKKMSEYQKIRAHALKLAFWPDNADLDWDWIKSLEAKRVGELRVDEVIAQQNNLRIIFFKANRKLPGDPMPRIWTLSVLQKKRQDFSGREIAAFRAMRDVLVARTYANIPGA